MADFTTLGDDEKLKIKVPVKGATNWGDTMKSDTFQKIADHDHSGTDGKGTKISKVGKDSEDTFIDGQNKIHMEKPVRFVPGNPPANPAIGDMYVDSNGVLYIFTKTGQACSLTQYADKATCIAGGGEWTEGTWETASATTSVQGASDTQFTVDNGTCNLSGYSDKATCETNGGTWTPSALNITQDQLLSWDDTAGQKKFKPVDRVVSTLNDVDTTGVTDGDLMVYDASTSKWKPDSRAGEIIMWAKAGSAPKNALYCDGSEISRTTYSELFSILGGTYGWGDGDENSGTTFNLPDYRNVFFRGSGGQKDNSTDIREPGDTQGDKTALPDNAFDFVTDNPGNHNHSTGNFQVDGDTGGQDARGSNDNPMISRTTSDAGEHDHSAASWSGGDSETRPANTAIAYYIRTK